MVEHFDFDEFLQKYRRDINCLSDQNRNQRKMALNTLNSKLFQEVDKEKLLQLVKNHLLKPLIMRLEDQIENNRELTIKLFTRLIDELDLNSEATIILQHLAGRISGNPFPETSEEVRLQVIDLFLKIAKTYPIQVKGALSETGSMLGRAFQDPNPAMKIRASTALQDLVTLLPLVIGNHLKLAVSSMLKNLAHQHSKVRKATLQGLGSAIKTKHGEYLLTDCLNSLRVICNDKSKEVRKTLVQNVSDWLNFFDYKYLKQYEAELALYLLNAIGDEDKDISQLSLAILEDYGTHLKPLMQMEEIGDSEKAEEVKEDSFTEIYLAKTQK